MFSTSYCASAAFSGASAPTLIAYVVVICVAGFGQFSHCGATDQCRLLGSSPCPTSSGRPSCRRAWDRRLLERRSTRSYAAARLSCAVSLRAKRRAATPGGTMSVRREHCTPAALRVGNTSPTPPPSNSR